VLICDRSPPQGCSLSLRDALPICQGEPTVAVDLCVVADPAQQPVGDPRGPPGTAGELRRGVVVQSPTEQPRGPGDDALQVGRLRSEEHTSELQSRFELVCRLLLEK